MHALYHTLLTVVILLTLPVWIWRYFSTPKYRGTVRQRLGWISQQDSKNHTNKPCVWLHAVSVGEVMAARELAARLIQSFPDHPLIITTVTRTGQQVAREKIPEAANWHYLPIDLPLCLHPLIDAIQPRLLVIMETELWPGLFRVLAKRGVPIFVVNGRISPRSFRRYHAIRALTRLLLADGHRYLMQSAPDAERLIAMGAPPDRVIVTGNLKYDQALKSPDPELTRQLALRLPLPEQPVWIAASTHPGEEQILLTIHRQLLAHPLAPRLILVPRHPERCPVLFEEIQQAGLHAQRFSATHGTWETPLLLVDEIGWLAALYRYGQVVFVGGSLVPRGGQNMLEAAAWGLPVLFGPHVFNFREIAAQLEQAGGALRIDSAESLRHHLTDLLENLPLRQKMGEAARAVIPLNAGALDRTIAAIRHALPEP
ncbi:MAG: 3-deoxy-D-manno-octulosonic acid transferase [Magnetococcales bacterium]|nr:3-deoxy-D-manno-octulosonic acid transferase [Magnetococcales bacterium]